ncbi:hypothetical protein Back11_19680 [Paenibacillus baekrokdamisoli]|uniref:Uncharacterized protein n=1 Tax=Paenibacillus baekrokdamisoli TaxID=1712516 RepID=A0A3G9J703_9BACL|nr:hypothetical protein [Paenibacillus baekrokdamisoli]MBB3070029.1 hypothetical protein [Paenibacillus baekrokdamisoli]BBH20623.1 hypothetical protein Back11_19680 [Paenibacillus baekrokdamisoli]
MIRTVVVLWENGPVEGRVDVTDGQVVQLRTSDGREEAAAVEGRFTIASSEYGDSGCRLAMDIETAEDDPADPVLVFVETQVHSFTFRLLDADTRYPIYLPDYGVAVTGSDDERSYSQIALDIRAKGMKTGLAAIESEPEESFENAAAHTKDLPGQTWLGLSRDMRIFAVGFRGIGGEELMWDWIQPKNFGMETPVPENGDKSVRYRFMLGRGIGCTDPVTRRLEDGCLPILHSRVEEDHIVYDTTSFVSYESGPLEESTLRGTNYLVADGFGHGHMFTEEQKKHRDVLLARQEELDQGVETVLYFQARVMNTDQVPRYAWFKNAVPDAHVVGEDKQYEFDASTGFVRFSEDRVCCVTRLNGIALRREETAILLKPGETAVIDMFLPHRPISAERADKLRQQSFEERLEESMRFWRGKLSQAASFKLPERRIEEMLRAGLLHLDVVTFGEEPAGTLVPAIGVYTAIGSESSPIIQFMDSMGWSKTAERSLQFFLDKQHDNGFIQNFGGYMLETGAALWSMGEHYRYTRNEDWVRQVKPQLLKAYEFLMAWRERNEREELRGKGYGMLEGKTADPEDPFRSFMLNGYACIGMSRLAEMLLSSDPATAETIRRNAEAFRTDIRIAFERAMALSPVVPLGDGSWVPTSPPWVEHRGPLSLYTQTANWLTHGSAVARDSLLGPLYLVLQEVIAPEENAASYMLHFHHELMCTRNVALSQPYYSIHPWVHLKRGEVKPFLKAYYNGFAGLADRETYTFWEHYFHASPHKTHEEGWFLMQTRWMLYMEEGRTLNLLPGIPRAWLNDGSVIEWKNAHTYFGPCSLKVESGLADGTVSASFSCDPDRAPDSVLLRLPHPEGALPRSVSGGVYVPEKEAVRIEPIDGRFELIVRY